MAEPYEDEEQKKPELQPGTSPTIAPAQGGGGFGFSGATADTTIMPKPDAPPKAPAQPTTTAGSGYSDPSAFGFAGTTANATTSGPAAGSTQSYMEGGLNEWLQNPSRYGADVVQQGASVIEQSLNKLRKQGQQALGEHYAGRGLVGSSLEGQGMRELEEEIQRQGNERLFNLQREQANTYGQDRAASLGLGLGFGDQSLRMLGMGQDDEFRKMHLDLQKQGMSADDAYRAATLQWQQKYGMSELGIRQQGTNNQYNLALATLLMNAPPDLLADPAVKEWMSSQFAGGGGTSGQFGFPATMTSGPGPQGAGTPPPGYGTKYGDGWNDGTPEGIAAQQQYMQGGGGQGGGTQTGGGYSPFGFQLNQTQGDLSQEARRRLGMSQTPMPNGVTSPIPGGGGSQPPGGGGSQPPAGGGAIPPAGPVGEPVPDWTGFEGNKTPQVPAPPPQPYQDMPGVTPPTGGTGTMFGNANLDQLNELLMGGGYNAQVWNPKTVDLSKLAPGYANDPEALSGLRNNYSEATLFRNYGNHWAPDYGFANPDHLMEYFTNPEGLTGSATNYKVARKPGETISPNEWQAWVDAWNQQQGS